MITIGLILLGLLIIGACSCSCPEAPRPSKVDTVGHAALVDAGLR